MTSIRTHLNLMPAALLAPCSSAAMGEAATEVIAPGDGTPYPGADPKHAIDAIHPQR